MTINTTLRYLTISGILMLTVSKNVYAQKEKRRFEIVQNLPIGQTYKYEIERGKADSKQPGLEHIKTITDVQLRILSQQAGYNECSWKYGSTKFTGVNQSQIDERSKKSANIYQGFEVKFTVDSNGVMNEITNFEACKTFLKNASDQLMENIPPDQRAQTMGMLWATVEPPEVLVNTYCPELTVFFSLFGKTIEEDSLYLSSAYLPNPFGGRKFPSEQTTRLENVKGDILGISVKLAIPAKDFDPIIKETFSGLAKHAGKAFNENDIPKVAINSTSLYRYNFKTKTLLDVSFEKFMEINGVKQIQTLKVALKK